MIVKLLTEHHLEFLSLEGGCRGSSESTHVKNVTLLEITCTGSFGSHVRSITAEFDSQHAYTLGPLLAHRRKRHLNGVSLFGR